MQYYGIEMYSEKGKSKPVYKTIIQYIAIKGNLEIE